MSFEVSKATSAETEELRSILEEGRMFKQSVGDEAWGDEPFTAEEAEARIAQGDTFIAEMDGKPAGCVTLLWHDKHTWGAKKGASGSAGYVHGLTVSDKFRGQHVGEQLITWAAYQTREAGLSSLRLDCPADNEKLCTYYESLGFARVATVQVHNSNASALYERKVE